MVRRGLKICSSGTCNTAIQPKPNRSPEEFSAGRLPISVNIPLPGLEEALAMGPELFQQKFGVNKPDLGDDIVVMCRCNNNYVLLTDPV